MYRKIYTDATQLAGSIIQGSGPAPAQSSGLKGLGARSQAKSASGIVQAGEEASKASYKERLGETMKELQAENLELKAFLENPQGSESPSSSNGVFKTNYSAKGKNAGYGEGVSKEVILSIVESEAKLRGIDPEVAKTVVAAEGLSAFQSQIMMKGGKQEPSYGPMQLYTGGGLGNEYQEMTGRLLANENHLEGVTNQIRFGLDKAVTLGWTPWYGAKAKNISSRQGLQGAKAVGNWKGN